MRTLNKDPGKITMPKIPLRLHDYSKVPNLIRKALYKRFEPFNTLLEKYGSELIFLEEMQRRYNIEDTSSNDPFDKDYSYEIDKYHEITQLAIDTIVEVLCKEVDRSYKSFIRYLFAMHINHSWNPFKRIKCFYIILTSEDPQYLYYRTLLHDAIRNFVKTNINPHIDVTLPFSTTFQYEYIKDLKNTIQKNVIEACDSYLTNVDKATYFNKDLINFMSESMIIYDKHRKQYYRIGKFGVPHYLLYSNEYTILDILGILAHIHTYNFAAVRFLRNKISKEAKKINFKVDESSTPFSIIAEVNYHFNLNLIVEKFELI